MEGVSKNMSIPCMLLDVRSNLATCTITELTKLFKVYLFQTSSLVHCYRGDRTHIGHCTLLDSGLNQHINLILN